MAIWHIEGDAETISTNALCCLNNVLPTVEEKQKIIAQSYDGAAVMSSNQRSAQSIVNDTFPNAHYVHCYVHQLSLVIHQAAPKFPVSGYSLSTSMGFQDIFSRSTKITACLDDGVARRVSRYVQTRRNLQSRIVSTVFEHRDELIECFEKIICK